MYIQLFIQLLRGENDIRTYSYLFNLYKAMSPYMTEDLHV